MKKIHIFILTIVIIVVGIVLLAVLASKNSPDNKSPETLSALQTIGEKLTTAGIKFYGASWCPHCAEQKSWFAKAVKSLPYIECSTAGAGSPQTQICIDAGIDSYPTWVFPDGKRFVSEIPPIDLAKIVKYEVPETIKAELQKQADEYFAKMQPAQKASYDKQLADVLKAYAK